MRKRVVLALLVVMTIASCFKTLAFGAEGKDYKIEDSFNSILSKKFISTKYNVSILFPSSWDMTALIGKYSVVKIRSDNGKGLENINVTVIPLDNKREYSIKDFEEDTLTKGIELLDKGRTEIANEQAIWIKMYFDSSAIRANEYSKDILNAPSFLYRTSEACGVGYQAQIVRNNHLYTITGCVLDGSKEKALKRYDQCKDMLLSMVKSFGFEKGEYYSPQHGFSISIPDGWWKLSYRVGILVSYGKSGSGENYSIRYQNTSPQTTMQQITWQQLFYPDYKNLSIEKEYSLLVDGKQVKYCIYKVIDPRMKKAQEGSYDLKYMAVAFINKSKLYLITFMDGSDKFNAHYPIFVDTVKSINFD